MTLTLELTPDAEEKLRRKASERGQELNDYAQDVLLTDADAPAFPTGENPPAPGESVFDSMKEYIGMFSGGGQTSFSENTGEKFAEALLEKRQQGRL